LALQLRAGGSHANHQHVLRNTCSNAFFRDNKQHNLPHIHARYQGDEAAISIEDGALIDGRLPPKQLKMV
jgi:hypothetical protein